MNMGININSVVPDKVVLIHSCCNFGFLLSYCMFLVISEHLYSIGRYSNLKILVAIFANEVIKIYTGYLSGLPMNELFWRDDRQLFLPNQKLFKLKSILHCVVINIMVTIFYYCVAVVFGVEMFSKHEETLLFSIMLCFLTALPACVHLGPWSTLNMIYGMKPNGSVALHIYRNIQLTLLGSWFGAFVFPLDWDRPWQEWPIACMFGSFLGSFTYNFAYICHYLWQRRLHNKSS